MIIVCYDLTSDKTRTQFSKYLQRYGHRIQYSVYVIKNSPRIIENITIEIEKVYKKRFTATDHILIFNLCKACQKSIVRYGSAVHELKNVVYWE